MAIPAPHYLGGKPSLHTLKVLRSPQQMAAVVREKRGEMEDALRIMETIRDNAKDIKDMDLKYMKYFIDERLKKLEKMK